jgi:hypothetical protein
MFGGLHFFGITVVVPVGAQTAFHVPVEEMLHGMVSLSNELARLAVTSVICGDFRRPLRIAAFLEELYAGFQMLNLRNDTLRKRFDSMKYDIKKVEEGMLLLYWIFGKALLQRLICVYSVKSGVQRYTAWFTSRVVIWNRFAIVSLVHACA